MSISSRVTRTTWKLRARRLIDGGKHADLTARQIEIRVAEVPYLKRPWQKYASFMELVRRTRSQLSLGNRVDLGGARRHARATYP
jgi:hypothetical protein